MGLAPQAPVTGALMPPGTVRLAEDDPTTVGDCSLVARLASAEPGSAYLGTAPDGRLAVVKVARSRPAGGNRARRNFADAASSRFPTRYTARVMGKGLHRGTAYLVREYVEGMTLAELVSEDGQLDPVTLNAVALATIAAIVAVHDSGAAHGNVKPSNVMITLAGVRLLDHCLGRRSGQPRPVPEEDVLGWGRVIAFAGGGGPTDDVAAMTKPLDHPVGQLVRRALASPTGERPSAREVLLGLVCPSENCRPGGGPRWRLRRQV
jgi:serine/threonine protein kinase